MDGDYQTKALFQTMTVYACSGRRPRVFCPSNRIRCEGTRNMEIDLIELLKGYPELVFFLVLGFGYLLGNFRVRRFRLGPTAGVLIAGLAFGHFGFTAPSTLKELGFILFIYSVGYRAGPRFFSVFAKDGAKYVTLCLVITCSAMLSAYYLSSFFGFAPSQRAGILAGGLTSTPTLAAAQDAVRSGMATLPPDVSVEAMVRDVSVSYAITYIYGLLGLTLLIRLIPFAFRINLHEQATTFAKERRIKDEDEDRTRGSISGWAPILRAYEVVSDEIAGKSLRELRFRQRTGCVIQVIKRDDESFDPEPDSTLAKGDRIAVFGYPEDQEQVEKIAGREVVDRDLLDVPIESCDITVTRPETVGKRVSELGLDERYGCILTKLTRSQIDLPLNTDLVLEKGDILSLTGLKSRLDELTQKIGQVERNIQETDLLTFAFGIAAGLVLGKIGVKVGTVSVGLGAAGGLLLSGIIVGSLRSFHPTFGRVPPAVRWIFMELGLMFFMAGVGLNAGQGIVETVLSVGPTMFLCGAAVTTVPLLLGFLFGYFVLRLNPALLLGALTGAMTSTAALNALSETTDSSVPGLGYAGTYAFSNILLALAGTLLILL